MTAVRAAPLITDEERAAAIKQAGDRCEKCSWLAWSYERHAQLVIVAKDDRATGKQVGSRVLCPTCAVSEANRTRRRRGKHGAR